MQRSPTKQIEIGGWRAVKPLATISKMNKGKSNTKQLLIVGPQPPPVGGATLTLQVLLDELEKQEHVHAALVDTRFATTYRTKRLLQAETLWRAVLILRDYARKVKDSDAILVFGNNAFIATMLAPLFLLARRYSKQLYLKPVGGDLDLYLEALPRPLRFYLLRVLRAVDGILAQTQQLCTTLRHFGCSNSHYVPGWRPSSVNPCPSVNHSTTLKLIYLSQIKSEKGVFVLLDALNILAAESGPPVTCDFYGPIYEDSQALFFQRLQETTMARYCGIAGTRSAIQLIATYDLLVLPTYFVSEGHPGVILEAMQAGVAVISTWHRAIPELITHQENGLLVPVQDSRSLADAIRQLSFDPALRHRMGAANYHRGQSFRAEVIVPRLLNLIFNI